MVDKFWPLIGNLWSENSAGTDIAIPMNNKQKEERDEGILYMTGRDRKTRRHLRFLGIVTALAALGAFFLYVSIPTPAIPI